MVDSLQHFKSRAECAIAPMTSRAGPWVIIAASFSLLQWHSISFWQRFTGEVGTLWSLSLEGISLWLWFSQYKGLATIASLLLICGPMYELGYPVVAKFKSSEQAFTIHKMRLSQAEQRLQIARDSLESYLANSRERAGWGGRIDKAQARVRQSQDEYALLLQQSPGIHLRFESLFVVVIQMVTLSVVMLAQVLAVEVLRLPKSSSLPKEVFSGEVSDDLSGEFQGEFSKLKDPKERSEINYFSKELLQSLADPQISDIELEYLISQVQEVISQDLSGGEVTQAEWAHANGISEKSMSLICNHERRRKNGQETISKNVVVKLAQRLNRLIQVQEDGE